MKKCKILIVICLATLSCLYFSGCFCVNNSDYEILFDFENENELDLLNWKCGTLFRLSNKWRKHGKSSLLIDFFPSDKIGFSCGRLNERNWSRFKAFSLTVFNPSDTEQVLYIRISDSSIDKQKSGVYERLLRLDPDENVIQIPIVEFKDLDGNMIDTDHIAGFYIYSKNNKTKETFYFDYFILNKL